MKFTIDAQGKRLGRVASEAAAFLMGKAAPSFRRYNKPDTIVEINNIGKIDIKLEKFSKKIYTHHTEYPGGLRRKSAAHMREKKGYAGLISHAVYGMLPKNKLRARMMKNLIINE